MRLGASIAVEEINANGGLLGQKLRLVMQNDQCEPKYAQQAANKLVGEEAAAGDWPFLFTYIITGFRNLQ